MADAHGARSEVAAVGVSASEPMGNEYRDRLKDTLPAVRRRIQAALARANGSNDHVTLVAVTKGHPTAAVEAALDAGLSEIGENRVGELERKVEQIGKRGVRWHMVGHLQRNKARRALPLFDLMHSVDSLRIARRLSREAERIGAEVRGLVQVNTSGEEAKGGFARDEVIQAVTDMAGMPELRIQGLMTMAPLTKDERVLRRTFSDARRLFHSCAEEVAAFEARHLSMGMSNDFELAIEEGSTMVRLGTVLFGEREQ